MSAKDFFENKRLQLIVISVFVFVMYARTISYEYIGLDDTTLIESNYKFIKNLNNIPEAFTHHVMYVEKGFAKEKDYYRPMLTLSFMLDAHIAGSTKPRWYHCANVLYHLTACLLLFTLLGRLKVKHISAFLLTILFSVHPVVDQAVAWIPGRNDVLLAIFVLSSFIFFLTYLETKKRKDLLWHLVFFGCALFTKENGIVLPILFMFYLRYNNPSLTLPKGKGTVCLTSPFLWKGFRIGVCYVAFIIPWFLLRRMALAGSISDNSIHAAVLGIINNAPFMLQYIGKAILPFNLSVMCMMEDANVFQEISAIIIIVAGIYFSKNKRWSFVWFGILWFVLFLVPSLSARLVEGLEHRLYVPIIGFIMLAAEITYPKSFPKERTFNDYLLPFGKVGMGCYLLVLLFITNNRLKIFSNPLSFNLSAVQSSKYSVTPCLDLAADYQTTGKKELAIEMYKTALYRDSVYGILHPNRRQSYYPILHDNLGVLYLDKQQYAPAEQQFVLAVACGDVYAMYHLANVYFKTNRLEQAAELWKKVLTLQPDQPDFKDVYLHLANYAKSKGDTAAFNGYVRAFKAVNSQ